MSSTESNSTAIHVEENSTVSSGSPVQERDAFVDENFVNGVVREDGQGWGTPQRAVLQDITHDLRRLRDGAPRQDATIPPDEMETAVPSVRSMR